MRRVSLHDDQSACVSPPPARWPPICRVQLPAKAPVHAPVVTTGPVSTSASTAATASAPRTGAAWPRAPTRPAAWSASRRLQLADRAARGCSASKATSTGATSAAASPTSPARRAAKPATTGSARCVAASATRCDRMMPYVTGGLAVGDVRGQPGRLRRRARNQRRAGPSAPASKPRSPQLDRQDRIPLRRSRQRRLQRRVLRRGDQRRLHRQHRARRRELQVLKRRAPSKSPGRLSGAFSCWKRQYSFSIASP